MPDYRRKIFASDLSWLSTTPLKVEARTSQWFALIEGFHGRCASSKSIVSEVNRAASCFLAKGFSIHSVYCRRRHGADFLLSEARPPGRASSTAPRVTLYSSLLDTELSRKLRYASTQGSFGGTRNPSTRNDIRSFTPKCRRFESPVSNFTHNPLSAIEQLKTQLKKQEGH